jgi:DNA-binding FadR family transcriptional regulator
MTRARHRVKNCEFHRQLFEAIRAHDGDKAHATMAKHVGDIQSRVHRSLAHPHESFHAESS